MTTDAYIEGRKVLNTNEAGVLLNLALFDKVTQRNVEALATEVAVCLDEMGYQITEKRPR